MESNNNQGTAVVFDAIGVVIVLVIYLATQLRPGLGVGVTMAVYFLSKEKPETTSFLEFLGLTGIAIIINLIVFTIARSLL